jgi:hypothetical protein
MRYNYVLVASILFATVYTVFFIWWEPDYREFWVAPNLSYIILGFLVINDFVERIRFLKMPLYATLMLFLGVICFTLFYYNFVFFLYEHTLTDFRVFDIIK